ncbi:MAG: hypothetical protein JWO81_1934 [Alphaproteobacteria bacterium]|nr:hypothetical protein [Alphaproteobacteria bacterium]
MAIVLLALPLNGPLFSCENDVVRVVTASDGAHDAVVFQRECGATTGFSTQISVLPHGETPSGRGNVFIADDDHGKAAAARWGGPWADIRWLSPDHLPVSYDTNSAVAKRQARLGGVRISYRAIALKGSY